MKGQLIRRKRKLEKKESWIGKEITEVMMEQKLQLQLQLQREIYCAVYK